MSTTTQTSVFTENPCLFRKQESKITVLPQIQKQIPIKIIFSDESENFSTSEDKEKNCEIKCIKEEDKIIYPFFIVKSRKKDKKVLRKKFNTVISRVHNMDCLLKKIKARFLKFVFTKIKKICEKLNIHLKKFSQNKEVRNLNIKHNRDDFLNKKIIDVLVNDEIISVEKANIMLNANYSYGAGELNLNQILNMKVKNFYQFHFLKSSYFKNWLKDPIKINNYKYYQINQTNAQTQNNTFQTATQTVETQIAASQSLTQIDQKSTMTKTTNKKSLNMSKNIFRTQPEDYLKYKKLLLHTSCNFIFYFQNNPLKFGKKKYTFFSTKN